MWADPSEIHISMVLPLGLEGLAAELPIFLEAAIRKPGVDVGYYKRFGRGQMRMCCCTAKTSKAIVLVSFQINSKSKYGGPKPYVVEKLKEVVLEATKAWFKTHSPELQSYQVLEVFWH